MTRLWALEIHRRPPPDRSLPGGFDTASWEEALRRTFDAMTVSVVARVVLRFAALQPKVIRIYPESGTESFSQPFVRSDRFPDGYAVEWAAASADGSAVRGSGAPANAELFFTPGNFVRYTPRGCRFGVGSFGDAIFLHEIVHAVRVITGRCDMTPTPRFPGSRSCSAASIPASFRTTRSGGTWIRTRLSFQPRCGTTPVSRDSEALTGRSRVADPGATVRSGPMDRRWERGMLDTRRPRTTMDG